MRFHALKVFTIPAVFALLILAACGGETAPPAGETPPTSPPSRTTAPAPVRSPDPTPEREPNWPQIQQVDPSALDLLETRTISDNEARIHIVVPQLAGHEDLNAHLHQWAQHQEESFRDNYRPDESPSAAIAAPSLTATWSVTAISPTMVGFYLESTESPGASTATYREVIWYNPTAGELVSGRDLLTDAAQKQLEPRIAAELEAQDVKIEPEEFEHALTDGDPALGFTERGELFIGFDSYEIGAGSLGAPSVALTLPGDRTDENVKGEDPADSEERENANEPDWLTDAGRAAKEASLEPETTDVPETPTAPDPPASESEIDCEKEKCVALTFDDGPSAKTTSKLLDILEREEVPATFFVLGTQAKAFPEIVARAHEDGHEIGSHTWKHANLTSLSGKALKKDLATANKAIKKATGVEPHLMRPPYGALDAAVAKAAKKADLALILWDVDTLDWDHRDAKKTVKSMKDVSAGSIVLMHDIHETTIDAVPQVIKKLRKAGFTPVTVSQLLGDTKPGESYFRGS